MIEIIEKILLHFLQNTYKIIPLKLRTFDNFILCKESLKCFPSLFLVKNIKENIQKLLKNSYFLCPNIFRSFPADVQLTSMEILFDYYYSLLRQAPEKHKILNIQNMLNDLCFNLIQETFEEYSNEESIIIFFFKLFHLKNCQLFSKLNI